MGTWNYKKTLFFLIATSIVIFIFGQNFEFVPPNPLFRPQTGEEVIMEHIRTPQSISAAKNLIERYLLRKPPTITQQDMSFEGLGTKALNKAAQNFLDDDEFQNSELGKTYREIEQKTKVSLKLKGSKSSNANTDSDAENDIEVAANQRYAYVKMSNQAVCTKMSYSVQNQNMDLLFQRQKNLNQSFGVGYDPKSEAGTVKMQLDW